MPDTRPPDFSEFYDQMEPAAGSPEGRLLVAVLQRAIADYVDPKSSEYVRDWAGNWLFSDSKAVMSVWWICQMVATEPDDFYLSILGRVNDMEGKPKQVGFRSGTR